MVTKRPFVSAALPVVGDRVRIQRDETRYPSKGTWPRFRGRVGTIVEVSHDKQPHLTEYAVVFSKANRRSDRPDLFRYDSASVVWFKGHEIQGTASERDAAPSSALPAIDDTGEHVSDARSAIGERSAEHLRNLALREAQRPIGPRPCPCGCGRTVTNWTQECYPQPWWDTPGLPPRKLKDRCRHHRNLCAYRDDDPHRCPRCHTIPERCTCATRTNRNPNHEGAEHD